MIHRVMPELERLKNIIVINDEAHHCYREKPADSGQEREELDDELAGLKGTDKTDAKNEAKERQEAPASGFQASRLLRAILA